MDIFFSFLTPPQLVLAFGVALCAGFIKGMVGFAMPLVMISGLTLFLSPELALAGLILPTVATNTFQALRQGARAAWASTKVFKVFLITGGIALVLSAQLVRFLPSQTMLMVIGVPVALFALWQLAGKTISIAGQSARAEVMIGGLAGAVGGVSGVWGPPTVAYLTALGTPKHDQMRIQGVIYGLGAVALLFAHMGSGVLRTETSVFSAAMILPALLGMWLGSQIMDRIDQALFRKFTLAILLVAGINLIRRGLLG